MKIQEIIEKNKNAVILIDVFIPGSNNQNTVSIRGTGFIVSPDGKFITCAHVYKQIPENELQYLGAAVRGEPNEKKLTNYKRYKVKLLSINEINDVALLQIISDDKFVAIDGLGDSEKVKEGDQIIYMGFPLATEMLNMRFGITLCTNQCIISSAKRRAIDGALDFFLVDTHINNGSSGSPAFSVETGSVMGIISGKISTKIPVQEGKVADIPANIGMCRPIQYAKELIAKNK